MVERMFVCIVTGYNRKSNGNPHGESGDQTLRRITLFCALVKPMATMTSFCARFVELCSDVCTVPQANSAICHEDGYGASKTAS
eukprot:6282746-Amphidinium_carterae.1